VIEAGFNPSSHSFQGFNAGFEIRGGQRVADVLATGDIGNVSE
jgi:hypothetical protein